MPGYLMSLFKAEAEKIRKAGVTKVFYGGEPFTREQIEWIGQNLGVRQIKSASYGSVDAGPIGYQCRELEGKAHHLHHNLHFMEVLCLHSDEPAPEGETGRLVLTSRARNSISLNRYDLGDVGRLRKHPCVCGRKSPVFELEGRTGDIFKAGGNFINFHTMKKIIREEAGLNGDIQVTLRQEGMRDQLLCEVISHSDEGDSGAICQTLIEHYPDIREVWEEGLLEVEVRFIAEEDQASVKGTQKKQNVRDFRC